MTYWRNRLTGSKPMQEALLAALVVLTSAAVYFVDKSVTAFLLLLGSLLVLVLHKLQQRNEMGC